MSESEKYLQTARAFAVQAELAATDEARHAFLRLAATYTELAREAAADDRPQRDAA